MDRGAKTARTNVAAKRPVAGKSRAPGAATARKLATRLAEALEQQTATSEILRLMAASPGNVQPVLDAVAGQAARLCKAPFARVFLVDRDVLRTAADHSASGERQIPSFPIALKRTSITGRAVLDGVTVHHADIVPLLDVEFPDARENAKRIGCRAVLAVPLMREGGAYGGIFLWRREPGPFAPDQVDLVQTFARQAAIAIENVRLFKELEARTTELTQSVGELKALGEVGQAVSSTLDLETVLRTIVARAAELSGVDGGAIYEYDEAKEQFYMRTADRYPAELVDVLRAKPIRKGEGALGRLAVVAEPVQILNIAEDRTYRSRVREILLRLGYRSLLAIPLVREDHLLGGLVVNRKSAGEFAPQVIELLKTFATQSALAIQNARLFREIEDKGRQIEVEVAIQDGMTRISVIDTGVGIAPEDLEAVFEEFRQVGTAARKVEGTGLGLAISRKLIELHGGRIWVTSKPGVGSTFAFTLPRPAGATG